jgi:adenylate kinase
MKVRPSVRCQKLKRAARGVRTLLGSKQSSILLLGPTGAGKSPLGEALERRGLGGHRWVHFDFGASLREVARLRRRPRGFTEREMAVIRHALAAGALLENENVPIAEKILERFRRKRRVKKGDILVLNGLPRHEGQAASLDRTLHVTDVVSLEADPDVIKDRIRLNTGGDRSDRVDDSAEEVGRKYAVYQKRTKPLLAYYRKHGARVRKLPVLSDTTAEDMLGRLAALLSDK